MLLSHYQSEVRMIKECKIISYNKPLHIIVFKFEEKLIQTTSDIADGTQTIYVNFNNGKYSICSKSDYEKSIPKKPIPKVRANSRKIKVNDK